MRLIDADELFKEDRAEFEKNPIFTNYDVYMSEVLREIDNAPTVVIRCKDCRYNADGICVWHSGNDYTWIVIDDDYCSCAEHKRKEPKQR